MGLQFANLLHGLLIKMTNISVEIVLEQQSKQVYNLMPPASKLNALEIY